LLIFEHCGAIVVGGFTHGNPLTEISENHDIFDNDGSWLLRTRNMPVGTRKWRRYHAYQVVRKLAGV
jgi:hypothetical protein